MSKQRKTWMRYVPKVNNECDRQLKTSGKQ